MKDINDYNLEMVTAKDSNKVCLRKYLRHERLYRMMKGGVISNDNSLFPYLDHFASDRATHIERLQKEVDGDKQPAVGPNTTTYNAEYLKQYFSDSDDDV